MQCPPNHQPPSEPDQHARGLRTRNRHAMKRVCRKVASTTDYNLHQGAGATRRSARARARSTYLLSIARPPPSIRRHRKSRGCGALETTDDHESPAKVESPGSRGVLSLSLFPRSRASSECISKKKLSTHHSQSSCPPSRKSRFLAFGRSCALKARRASFSRRAGEHTSSFAQRQCRHADVFR